MKQTSILSVVAAALLLLGFVVPAQAQNTNITIGDYSAYSTAVPTDCYYKNSVTQFIYTASEIGGPCNINSIAFEHLDHPELHGGCEAIERSFEVFFTLTSQSDYSSDSWVNVSVFDWVYSAGVTMPDGQATVTLTLNAPFHYDGTSNLAVTVIDNNTSYANLHYFYGNSSGSVNRSLSKKSDDTSYDYEDFPSDPTASTFRPLIILGTSPYSNDCDASMPYEEDFSDVTNALNCWTAIDADDNGVNWGLVYDSPSGDGISLYSYSSSASDDWVISPAITIDGDNAVLNWQDYYYGTGHYSVYVSTSGTQIDDFNTTPVFSTDIDDIDTWTLRAVDLSDYYGQTIHIAFRHHGATTFHSYLQIAELSITSGGTLNANIVGAEWPYYQGVQYYIDAVAVGDTLGLSAATTTYGAEYSWELPGATPSTAAGATVDAVWSQAGTYTVTLTATRDNQTATDTHEVTVLDWRGQWDDTIAYCDDIYDNALGMSSDEIWGIRIPAMHLEGRSTLSEVQIYKYPNNVVTGDYELLVYQGSRPLEANKVFDTIVTISEGGWQSIAIADGLNLDQSKDLWIGFNYQGGNSPATVSSSCNDRNGGFQWYTNSDSYLMIQMDGMPATWMIRAITQGNAGIGSVDAISATLSPNPTTGMVHLNCTDPVSRVEVIDQIGRTLATSASTEVDLTALPAGAYLLRITTATAVTVQRVLKK